MTKTTAGMKRISVELPNKMYRELRIRCLDDNATLRMVVTQAIAEWLHTTWLGEPVGAEQSDSGPAVKQA